MSTQFNRNRVYVALTDDQIAALKVLSEKHGSPVAEQIRRCINLALFADQQSESERHKA